MGDIVIDTENICKKFKDQEVLKNVNLTVKRGEICGIMGRNGSGKTVLFKCLCRLLIPDQGLIRINGKNISRDHSITQEIGTIIENPAFLEDYNGIQNLAFLAGLRRKIGKQEIWEALRLVGLEAAAKKKVKKYSMGMRQRLAIAQTIMEKQQIQILDEPMNGLDKTGVEEIRKVLLELKSSGNSILIASHNPFDMELLCDSIYEMDNGVLKAL